MHWHDARDGDDEPIKIGVSSYGMSIYQNMEKKHAFPWSWIMKLSFKRKQFYVQIRNFEHNANTVDTILIFNALCQQSCKMLWKSCIEHHTFFRLIAPPAAPPKKLFNLMGSRFRYSGRTEYQTIEEMRQKPRVERVFERSRGRSARSTISGLPPSGRNLSSSRTSTPTNTSTTNSPNLSARLFRKQHLPSWLPTRRALSILRESTMRQKFASLGKRRSFGSMSLLCINPRLIGPPR
ncbi:hypothetical protein L596_025283 [Steinernema carpocapsae]|uniref:FERM domain-containing protein n=1 Tax=Steinernema carpocapsae TaxID=34508 RepID=A0A4U5M7E2_STECR|nr:hypothetical protein L596_025283 [Steinernema carpocapsae]